MSDQQEVVKAVSDTDTLPAVVKPATTAQVQLADTLVSVGIKDAAAEMPADDLAAAEALAGQLNLSDQLILSSYGGQAMSALDQVTQALIGQARTSKSGEAAKELSTFLRDLQSIDTDSLEGAIRKRLRDLPGFGRIFKQVEAIMDGLEPVLQKVDDTKIRLQKTQIQMLEDVQKLNDLYNQSSLFIREIKKLVVALRIRQTQEVAKRDQLQAQMVAGTGGDPVELSEKIEAQNSLISAMDIKITNLEQIRVISIQARMTAKSISNGDFKLAIGLGDQVLTAVSVWRMIIANSIALLRQKEALDDFNRATEATTKMVEKNAALLHQQAVDVAKSTHAGIVDEGKLQAATDQLIQAVKEVMDIEKQAHAEREKLDKQKEAQAEALARAFSQVPQASGA